ISGLMPGAVVDRLEVIQIDDGKGAASIFAASACPLCAKRLKPATIENARQRITMGEISRLFVEHGVCEGDGGKIGDGLYNDKILMRIAVAVVAVDQLDNAIHPFSKTKRNGHDRSR